MKSKFLIFFCLVILSTPFFVFGYDATSGNTSSGGAPTTGSYNPLPSNPPTTPAPSYNPPPSNPSPSAPSSPSMTNPGSAIAPASYSAPANMVQPNTAVPAFQSLVGIPGIPDITVPDLQFGNYINALYRLAISIAALIAVLKIVIAGVKYMLDDIVTHKQEAKADIRGALVGLLVILAAYLILNTINSDITKNQIAVNPIANLDATARLEDSYNKMLEAMKSVCDKSDPKNGEWCESEPGFTKEQCDIVHGIFDPGSWSYLIPLQLGGINNNLRDYCTYVKKHTLGEWGNITMTGSSTIDQKTCESNPTFEWGNNPNQYFDLGCYYVGKKILLPEDIAKLSAKVCTGGSQYTCKVLVCGVINIDPLIGQNSCTTWCNDESKHSGTSYSGYDKEFNACYGEFGG